ncbi:MAG: DUF6273 domain-containing protein [bacterium]|nr:DUF6273 domain-containing protein [bacterium]
MSKKKYNGKKHSKNNISSAPEVSENAAEAKEAQNAELADNATEEKAQNAKPSDSIAEGQEIHDTEPVDSAAEGQEAQNTEPVDNVTEVQEAQNTEPADNADEDRESSAASADLKPSESSDSASAKKKKHKSSDSHKSSHKKSQSSKETNQSSSEKKQSLAIPLFVIIFAGLAVLLLYNHFHKNGQEPVVEASPVVSASATETPSPVVVQTEGPSAVPVQESTPGTNVPIKTVHESSVLLDKTTASSGFRKYIKFGNYPQNQGDKPEPIEWIVLGKDDEAQLLVSRYGLDCKPFNSEFEDVAWNDCELRKWLNNDFLNTAFSFSEKNKIIETKLDIAIRGNNQNQSGDNGNFQKQSEDKIFCLSMIEAEKLFESDEKRACEPTDYAVSHNAYKDPDTGFCLYWLRSPGLSANGASVVLSNGQVWSDGHAVHENDHAVRPALRMRL